jgi:hypothetical protein
MSRVKGSLKNLARLEGEDSSLGDLDGAPGLRIASRTLALVSKDELSETADLDFLGSERREARRFGRGQRDRVSETMTPGVA